MVNESDLTSPLHWAVADFEAVYRNLDYRPRVSLLVLFSMCLMGPSEIRAVKECQEYCVVEYLFWRFVDQKRTIEPGSTLTDVREAGRINGLEAI